MTGEKRIIEPRAGASDGTTPLSWKIVTTANCSWSMPFETQPIVIYNETLTAQTATVEGIWGGGALPTDAEIFLELEYLGDGSSPLATLVNDGTPNLLATPAAQTASSATWGGALVSLATWNPADLSGVTLSNGNLTATGSGGVRGIGGKTSGKYYVEYTYTAINSNTINAGFALITATLGGPLTGAVYPARASGNIMVNGGASGSTLGIIANASVIGVAVDLTAQLIWFRVAPAGNWNGNGTANPATGTGGVSISTISSGALYPIMTGQTDTLTANFGASAFTGAVPSGFTAGWPVGAAPAFKLSVPFTAAQPGWLYARIKCAKPSSTFYVDPKVTLS